MFFLCRIRFGLVWFLLASLAGMGTFSGALVFYYTFSPRKMLLPASWSEGICWPARAFLIFTKRLLKRQPWELYPAPLLGKKTSSGLQLLSVHCVEPATSPGLSLIFPRGEKEIVWSSAWLRRTTVKISVASGMEETPGCLDSFFFLARDMCKESSAHVEVVLVPSH